MSSCKSCRPSICAPLCGGGVDISRLFETFLLLTAQTIHLWTSPAWPLQDPWASFYPTPQTWVQTIRKKKSRKDWVSLIFIPLRKSANTESLAQIQNPGRVFLRAKASFLHPRENTSQVKHFRLQMLFLRDAKWAKSVLHAKVRKSPGRTVIKSVLTSLRPRLAVGTVNRYLGFTVKLLVPNFKPTKIHPKARKYYRK